MELWRSNPSVLDYEDGLERFVNKPELYHKFLGKFLEEQVFDNLKKAMEEEDYKSAFQYAHTLKGNTGNLSLTHLYQATIPLVEALRGEQPDVEKAKELYQEVADAFEEAVDFLKEFL